MTQSTNRSRARTAIAAHSSPIRRRCRIYAIAQVSRTATATSGPVADQAIDAPAEQPPHVGVLVDRPDLHLEAGAWAWRMKRGDTTRSRPACSGT